MSYDPPINPGCEVTTCGCDHGNCDAQMCGACDEEWPCEKQQAFLKSDAAQLGILKHEVAEQRQEVQKLTRLCKTQNDEIMRLARIVEEALMPFMRDMMQSVGGRLVVGARIGDRPSLVGLDPMPGVDGKYSFNRSGAARTNDITYTGARGRVWTNGRPGK